MAGVPKTIAELVVVVDELTLRVEALEKAKSTGPPSSDALKQITDQVSLFGSLVVPLLENDRASAIEQLRRWQKR
jgi:hypothetical protein